MQNAKLAVRVKGNNQMHHIYLNNGVYWCHYTIHLPDFTKRRVRQSLRTKCPNTARLERDRLLARLQAASAELPLAA